MGAQTWFWAQEGWVSAALLVWGLLANSTWHFDMGCLRFASSVRQVAELCELGQQLTLHVLKIGAALKCLGHQVCLVSPG